MYRGIFASPHVEQARSPAAAMPARTRPARREKVQRGDIRVSLSRANGGRFAPPHRMGQRMVGTITPGGGWPALPVGGRLTPPKPPRAAPATPPAAPNRAPPDRDGSFK